MSPKPLSDRITLEMHRSYGNCIKSILRELSMYLRMKNIERLLE